MPLGAEPPAAPARPTSTRPAMPWLTPDEIAAYDWMAANGVDEPLPDDVRVVIADGEITYTAFAFVADGDRWQSRIHTDDDGEIVLHERTVPLLAEPSDQVRRGFGAALVEATS